MILGLWGRSLELPSDVRSWPKTTPARPNAVPGAYRGLTVPVRPTPGKP